MYAYKPQATLKSRGVLKGQLENYQIAAVSEVKTEEKSKLRARLRKAERLHGQSSLHTFLEAIVVETLGDNVPKVFYEAAARWVRK